MALHLCGAMISEFCLGFRYEKVLGASRSGFEGMVAKLMWAVCSILLCRQVRPCTIGSFGLDGIFSWQLDACGLLRSCVSSFNGFLNLGPEILQLLALERLAGALECRMWLRFRCWFQVGVAVG